MAARPNIVHIICHDLGRHLRCYGRPDVASPNLDRLAAEGVRFANCFTPSPPCSPARGCMMTGRYAHSNGQIGLTHRGFPLPDGEQTIVDYLNDAGYVTAHIGFQHERQERSQNRYQRYGPDDGDCEAAARAAGDFLADSRGTGAPFYLNVGFNEVHLPFTREVYAPDDPVSVSVPAWLPDNVGVREELGRFNGAIRWMDEAVGTIIDAVHGAGRDHDTVVLFTTDHGMAFPRAKGMLYDAGIGVALIARLPERVGRNGYAVGELISTIDIAPTLVELAGAPIPQAVQGQSFLGLLAGGSYEPNKRVFAEKNYHDCYDPIRAVRTAGYKYIRNFETRRKIILSSDLKVSSASAEMWPWANEPRDAEELYDLRADPAEMRNLAASPGMEDVKAELSAHLRDWMQSTDDPLLRGPIPAPPGARVSPIDWPVK